MDLNKITRKLIEFRDARNWEQYHTPANLATALSVEAGELLREFLWGWPTNYERVKMEVADVAIFLLYLIDSIGIDLETVIMEKIELNGRKYPA